MKRAIVSALLLLSILPMLMLLLAPHAYSQSYVTTVTNQILSEQFTVSGWYLMSDGYTVNCSRRFIQLSEGLAGTELFGSISASQPINFWVLSYADYKAYLTMTVGGRAQGNLCSRKVPHSARVMIAGNLPITSYSLHWKVPDSATYYFVFANPERVDSDVSFRYWSQESSTVTSQTNTSPTSGPYIVPPVPWPSSSTTQVTSSQQPITPLSLGPSPTELGLILAIVVGLALVVGVGYQLGKKRSKSS